MEIKSWGLYPQTHSHIKNLDWLPKTLTASRAPILAHGLGRSYGDSCLNDEGTLLLTDKLNRYKNFDAQKGILTAECGVGLNQILLDFVPRGWFLPVTPGTKFVTLGGAIANDVHGKNHHKVGTFGHHILSLELLRSDGVLSHCSSSENSQLFYATIGGLGLTGFILTATLQLEKIESSYIEQEIIPFENIHEFYLLSKDSALNSTYSVAWIDCFANSKEQNRGLFYRGNFSSLNKLTPHNKKQRFSIPFHLPRGILNSLSIKIFNEVYFQTNKLKSKKHLSHYDPFFYPLDSIHQWNRIYGKAGFYQYQCLIPHQQQEALSEILKEISRAQQGSFLAVLKVFGDIPSLGAMSFPQAGVTLALDFPVNKDSTKLLEKLDLITMEALGKVYIAKDARMSPQAFRKFYPQFEDFQKYIDPQFSSSFLRRVT